MRKQLISLLAASYLLLGACTAPASTTPATSSSPKVETSDAPAARPARTLVAPIRVEPGTLAAKPIGLGGVGTYLTTRLFNADLAVLDDEGVPGPYLAESLPQLNSDSWKLFPDGRMETTYRLKPNLAWHDGSPLTSADWAFSLRVYSTPELGAAKAAPIPLIDGVRTPDERTLIIDWKRPFALAGALNSAATGAPANFPALPRSLLESAFDTSTPDVFMNHPYWTQGFVGLGPYRLARWEAGSFIEAEVFDKHAPSVAKIPRIKLLVMPDANAAIAALLSGDAQLASSDANLPVSRVREVLATLGPAAQVILHPNQWRRADIQLRPEYVGNRALLDVRVRRALAYSVDKDTINEAIYDGQSLPAETMVPPTSAVGKAIDAAIAKYPFDLRRAEEQMVAAGFVRGPDGVYTSPTLGRFTSEIKTNASVDNVAEMSVLASGWRQVGLDMQDAILPAALAQDADARATFPGLFSANGNVEGAINFKSLVTPNIPVPARFTNESRGGWSNPEYAELNDRLNVALDAGEQTRLMVQMAKIFNDEVPALSLFFNTQPWIFGSSLKGPRTVAAQSNLSWRIYDWEFN
jgi:peptide/nickel transport system substrate-binding protein